MAGFHGKRSDLWVEINNRLVSGRVNLLYIRHASVPKATACISTSREPQYYFFQSNILPCVYNYTNAV